MKRSEYIALGAIGVMLAATFWPRGGTAPTPNDPAIDAATGSGFTTLAFASLDECRQSQAVTEQVCGAEWGKAQQATIADAPKYDQLADCEAEYGASQCRPATWNGAQVFIPALAGVLIARSLAGAAASSQPLYPPRVGPQSCPPGVSAVERPECQTRSSSSGSGSSSSGGGRSYYSTGSGRVIGRVAGAVIADAVMPSRTTVSRTTVAPRGGSFTGTPSNWNSPSSTTTSRPSGGFSPSSTATTSRGGFGSSGSSFSSSSS
jgi:uncharacterized protein YgiB involved in biofilm formation